MSLVELKREGGYISAGMPLKVTGRRSMQRNGVFNGSAWFRGEGCDSPLINTSV